MWQIRFFKLIAPEGQTEVLVPWTTFEKVFLDLSAALLVGISGQMVKMDSTR